MAAEQEELLWDAMSGVPQPPVAFRDHPWWRRPFRSCKRRAGPEVPEVSAVPPVTAASATGYAALLAHNPDAFYTGIYAYYYAQGFAHIILQRITSLVMLTFTVVFATFLMAGVRWSLMASCTGEDTCGTLSSYVVNPFDDLRSRGWEVCMAVVIPMIGFVVYVAWYIMSSVGLVSQANQVRVYYRDMLRIRDRDLQTMEWEEIVRRLESVVAVDRVSGPSRFSFAQEVAMRVLRKENYLIALMNGWTLKNEDQNGDENMFADDLAARQSKLLNMSVCIPFVGMYSFPISDSLEWNLKVWLSLFDVFVSCFLMNLFPYCFLSCCSLRYLTGCLRTRIS